MKRQSFAVALLFAAVAAVPAQRVSAQASTFVIVVRHAEKATTAGNDPELSEAGQARARALADALANANVSAVITSTTKRTNETAALVAQARGVKAEPIGLNAQHVQSVADAVRKHPGEVVLVVGHSNTVPAIVAALGGPKLPDLCDAVYSTIFTMEIGGPKNEVRVVRSTYGAADPAGADQCQAPKPK